MAAWATFLTACSVTTLEGERIGMRDEAFAAYVERVFRAQNRVATSLAFELEREDIDSSRYAALEAAELELLDACAGLNELAIAARDGRAARGLGAARRARSAADCERATIAAERLLRAGAEPSG